MTLTIELTPEQEEWLQAAAAEAGVDIATFAQDLILDAIEPTPQTGKEMVDYMRRTGVAGLFSDRPEQDIFQAMGQSA